MERRTRKVKRVSNWATARSRSEKVALTSIENASVIFRYQAEYNVIPNQGRILT